MIVDNSAKFIHQHSPLRPIFVVVKTIWEYLPKFDFSEIATYVFFAFAFFALVQLIYVLFIYGRLAFHNTSKEVVSTDLPPVSVIIAARNESENLFKFLPFILEQEYPQFEVIVINHQSIDDSKYILGAYTRQYPHLKIIEIERNKHIKYGKKLPLTVGIKGAKYEHLVFTDADCKPSSQQWLKSMASRFNDKKEIVLGYGPYNKKKGFINRMIRFDTTWIAMSYFSMAKAGMPYMGIGRNMAYTKSAFERAEGFKSHYGIASGDDDLFIQDAALKKNYTINIDENAFCYSKPAKNLEQWARQKARHYTTSPKYKVFKKLMLGIYPLTLLFLLISFVSLLFNREYIWLSLAVFLLTLIVKWIVLGRAFSKLKAKSFIAAIPLWDIFYAIWTPIMFYTVSKTDDNKW